jgi:hypothetical protein
MLVVVVSCTHKPHHTGKWYSYSDEGDYQEFWVGEDRALSYFIKVDKFFLYEYTRSGDSLKFNLIESDVVNSHQFTLLIKDLQENVMVTGFIGDTKNDPVKSFFRISEQVEIATDLAGNFKYRDEIIGREAAGGQSHEGHNH